VVRARRGGDVRLAGSGNAGTRNVARTHGWLAATATFLIDAAKAALAVLLARLLVRAEWASIAAVAAVIAGHIWPVQLAWRGGKGAAPAVGGMLAADPFV